MREYSPNLLLASRVQLPILLLPSSHFVLFYEISSNFLLLVTLEVPKALEGEVLVPFE